MKDMFTRKVVKILTSERKYLENEFIIEGVPEAELAPTINELMKEIKSIYIKSHPNVKRGKPWIRLHIYSREYTQKEFDKICNMIKEKIILTHKCNLTAKQK